MTEHAGTNTETKDESEYFCGHIEEVEPYGELKCIAIYAWYDGPLIYALKSESHLLFVYLIDSDEEQAVFWYFPITEQQLSDIDNQKMCLRTALTTLKGVSITRHCGGQSSSPIEIDTTGVLLPEFGIYLSRDFL